MDAVSRPLALIIDVRDSCVIVHVVAGRRFNNTDTERPNVRSARAFGRRVMNGTTAETALTKAASTNSRSALQRSCESRSAAGAGNDNANNTVVLLKVRSAFRKSYNDLANP